MNKAMFIVVRDDLGSTGLKAAQGAHALAQFLIDYPDEQGEWNNNYLIFLKTDNLLTMEKLIDKMKRNRMKFSVFKEPDLNDEITALACYTKRDSIFKNLKLFN